MPSPQRLPSNINKEAPDSVCWCVAKLSWKMYCPNGEALLLCIVLANGLRDLFHCGLLIKCDFSWFAANCSLFQSFLIRNIVSVWNSVATTAQKRGQIGMQTLPRTCTSMREHTYTPFMQTHTHRKGNIKKIV